MVHVREMFILHLLLMSCLIRDNVVLGKKSSKDSDGESCSFWTKATMFGAGVIGAGAAIAAVPAVLGVAGFTAAGVAANSVAAGMISAGGNVAAGGAVATLQSVGAAGLGAAGNVVVGTVGGALAAATTYYTSDCPGGLKKNKKNSNC